MGKQFIPLLYENFIAVLLLDQMQSIGKTWLLFIAFIFCCQYCRE